MAKKTHVKVRLVPEAKPDSPFFYYVKKPAGGEKAKVKLKNAYSVALIASPKALIKLSISDFSMIKGGASWIVSPP